MLTPSQYRSVERIARDVATTPLPGTDLERHTRMRTGLLFTSRAKNVQMEWGEVLPDPEVSLVFLERLTELSPVMARIGINLSLTVDAAQGCWALPLLDEYDEKGRARYPKIYNPETKKQGEVAHRYVWRELINPNIPTHHYLDHLCRVHACCNPSHLEPVSSSDNAKRGNNARHILGGQQVLFHPE